MLGSKEGSAVTEGLVEGSHDGLFVVLGKVDGRKLGEPLFVGAVLGNVDG